MNASSKLIRELTVAEIDAVSGGDVVTQAIKTTFAVTENVVHAIGDGLATFVVHSKMV